MGPPAAKPPEHTGRAGGSKPLCPERYEGSWGAVLQRVEGHLQLPTQQSGSHWAQAVLQSGVPGSVPSPQFFSPPSTQHLFGLGDYRPFKVLLCLFREQTYEVSQVFIWCLSFLPWKMVYPLLICTPQKLIGATNFLTQ